MTNDSGQAPPPVGQPSPSAVAGGGGRTSDRVLGFLCLTLGIWYVFETRNFAVTQFGTGPVGPKTLPTIIGILFSGMALFLILKPDESPTWAPPGVWVRTSAVVATSFLFGQVLQTLGFIIASTLLAIIIGTFFKGPIAKLAPLSLVFAVAVAFVFNNWLELRLPPGWWGGF